MNMEKKTAEEDEFASVRHLVGKHVKIIAKDHPWYGEVGHIKDWGRIVTGSPYCEVELDNGVSCCVFNGKELKYI